MKTKLKENILLLVIIIISGIIHMYELNHGTPNLYRSLQVFGLKENIIKFSQDMILLRDKLFDKQEDFVNKKEKVTKKSFAEHFVPHKHKYFDLLSKETILDFSRGYLIGLTLSDEQHVIRALSNLNPVKLDFDPNHEYNYGNFYLYSLGAMLIKAKIFNLITINRDVSYYFTRPQENAKIYIVARLFSAIFVLFSVVIIWFLVEKFFKSKAIAFLSTIFFVLNPFILNYSHQIKAHTYGMFLILLGILFYLKNFNEDKDNKSFLLSTIFVGLSTASVLSNGIFVIFLIFADIIVNKNFNYKKYFIFGLISFLVYLIMNPYLPFRLRQFYVSAIGHNIAGYGYGRFDFFAGIKFLFEAFQFGHLWILLPICFVGIFYGLREEGDKKFLSILFLSYFLFSSFVMKHEGVFSVNMPLFSIFSAYGIYKIIIEKQFIRYFGVVYLLITIFIFILGTIFYSKLFVVNGNLTFAGKWINENIPRDASIGIPNGWAMVGTFPPIKFLDYKLINFPTDEKVIENNIDKFPEYLVVTKTASNNLKNYKAIKENYNIVKIYEEPKKILGIHFTNKYISTENQEVIIYKNKMYGKI